RQRARTIPDDSHVAIRYRASMGVRIILRTATLLGLFAIALSPAGASVGHTHCRRDCRPAIHRCVELGGRRLACRPLLVSACLMNGPTTCEDYAAAPPGVPPPGVLPPGTPAPPPVATAHYEYVFPDGECDVYDMDHDHRLVQTIDLPQARGIRGVVA